MSWWLQSFEKYTDFNGRSRRTEWWMFAVFTVMGEFLIYVVSKSSEQAAIYIAIVFILGIIIPSVALVCRRLHDTSNSGWLFLIGFIPIFGSIPLLYLLGFKDSDPGENEYGPNPKTVKTRSPDTT